MSLPQIGKAAPSFTEKAVLIDKVVNISLSDYKNRYLILLFYPMDFGYVCPTDLIAFNNSLRELRTLNADVVACSNDSCYSHLRWLSMSQTNGGIRGVQIPLIADKSMSIAKKYGVLNEEDGSTFRALCIIDGQGILRQITVNDRCVGLCVPETFRLIRTIQYADQLRQYSSDTRFIEVSGSHFDKRSSLKCSEKQLLRDLIE